MSDSSTRRAQRARRPRGQADAEPLTNLRPARGAASAAQLKLLSVELGPERLAFLEAECEREYWRSVPDALRHLIDLRMRALFRADQRRAVARVRSLLKRERRRLAHRSADADLRLAVRRVIEQIETGDDPVLRVGLRLLRAMDARDAATLRELTSWRPPDPPARRRVS